jgi:hypothetical protein
MKNRTYTRPALKQAIEQLKSLNYTLNKEGVTFNMDMDGKYILNIRGHKLEPMQCKEACMYVAGVIEGATQTWAKCTQEMARIRKMTPVVLADPADRRANYMERNSNLEKSVLLIWAEHQGHIRRKDRNLFRTCVEWLKRNPYLDGKWRSSMADRLVSYYDAIIISAHMTR